MTLNAKRSIEYVIDSDSIQRTTTGERKAGKEVFRLIDCESANEITRRPHHFEHSDQPDTRSTRKGIFGRSGANHVPIGDRHQSAGRDSRSRGRHMNHLSKKKRPSLQQGRSGAALLISIIVLILTSAISLSLLKTTTLRQYRFQNRLQKIQANSLAESAISYATVKLQCRRQLPGGRVAS